MADEYCEQTCGHRAAFVATDPEGGIKQQSCGNHLVSAVRAVISSGADAVLVRALTGVEVTLCPDQLREGDVIVAVAVPHSRGLSVHVTRKHPFCGLTVKGTEFLGVVRNAQRAVDPTLVELTFADGTDTRVEAYTPGWVVRRGGSSV